jgi:hypothetical protein
MNNAKGKFQIVEVLGVCSLRDAEGNEHPYWRRDGHALAPGFYIAHWPADATVGRFNEDALFEGPFRQRSGAEAALPRIIALAESEDAWGPRAAGLEAGTPIFDDRSAMRSRRPT